MTGLSGDRSGPSPARSPDALRYWLPLMLSLITTILMIGVLYGTLGGRLDLIEYRLHQIELKLMEH